MPSTACPEGSPGRLFCREVQFVIFSARPKSKSVISRLAGNIGQDEVMGFARAPKEATTIDSLIHLAWAYRQLR
jgi:hypothetical protein